MRKSAVLETTYISIISEFTLRYDTVGTVYLEVSSDMAERLCGEFNSSYSLRAPELNHPFQFLQYF